MDRMGNTEKLVPKIMWEDIRMTGRNKEGYPDPTANQAVGIVSREEKEAAKAKKRATREYDIRAAMKAIRAIAGAYGLTIENRITFKDKETEEIFR